jgi:hypothetical protein
MQNNKKAARLLLEIRKYAGSRGIRSVHDTRLDPALRQLWLRLLASNAVQSLSLRELGQQWRCMGQCRGRPAYTNFAKNCVPVRRLDEAGQLRPTMPRLPGH